MSRKGWPIVRLGDILEKSAERLGLRSEPEILTCTEKEGLVLQREKFSKRIAIDDTSAYKVVRLFDVVYNPYLLWAGAIAQSLEEDLAITSPVYEVFRPRPGVAPAFLGLLLARPNLIRLYDTVSIGSVPRRRRAPADSFLELSVAIPPVALQRRIIDLMGTVDSVANAIHREVNALQRALDASREEVLSAEYQTGILSELLEKIDAGRSPAGENRLPDSTERAVLKVSAIRVGFFDKTQVKVVSPTAHLPEGSRVERGDVLVSRANTQELAGIACRVHDVPDNYYLCDKTLRLVPRPETDSDFLLELLLSSRVRSQLRDSATGTSGSMKNISQAKLLAVHVVIPSTEAQGRIAALLSAFRRNMVSAKREAEAVMKAREALLADLIEGTHEIPDSYDRFLEAV